MLALAVPSGISLYFFIVCGFYIAKVANLPANFAEKALVGLAAINTLTTVASLFFPSIPLLLLYWQFALCHSCILHGMTLNNSSR